MAHHDRCRKHHVKLSISIEGIPSCRFCQRERNTPPVRQRQRLAARLTQALVQSAERETTDASA